MLPQWLLEVPHVVIRRGEGELLRDAQLKLRCANATHTAVVYTMALSGSTSIAAACASHPHLLLFLDRLYARHALNAPLHRPQPSRLSAGTTPTYRRCPAPCSCLRRM